MSRSNFLGPDVLTERRRALLMAMSANDLARIRARVTGETIFRPGKVLRAGILADWHLFAEEIRRWCDFTIAGK